MSANSNQDPIMFTTKDYVPYSFFYSSALKICPDCIMGGFTLITTSKWSTHFYCIMCIAWFRQKRIIESWSTNMRQRCQHQETYD